MLLLLKYIYTAYHNSSGPRLFACLSIIKNLHHHTAQFKTCLTHVSCWSPVVCSKMVGIKLSVCTQKTVAHHFDVD